MGISTLQLEHLIDGKKPEARAVFAMFAFHFFAKLRLVSRMLSCCLYTIMRGSVFVPRPMLKKDNLLALYRCVE